MAANGSVPAFGTGVNLAVTNNAGTPSDPVQFKVALGGSSVGAFPIFGTGTYFATASGAGTPTSPYVPLVAVASSSGFVTNPATADFNMGGFDIDNAAGINDAAVLPNTIGTAGQTTLYGDGSHLTGIAPSIPSQQSYYSRLNQLLEPFALESMTSGTNFYSGSALTYTVSAAALKYCLASYNVKFQTSGGYADHRDPGKDAMALYGPLTLVQAVAAAGGGNLLTLDPTIPLAYANASETYFSRLQQLETLPLKHVDINAQGTSALLLPGPYGSLIRRVSQYNVPWTILQGGNNINGLAFGWNLVNEIDDNFTFRQEESMFLPILRNHVTQVATGTLANPPSTQQWSTQAASVMYYDLPATWSANSVPDPLAPYRFQDDFMGATLSSGTWNIIASGGAHGGEIGISTYFPWVRINGDGTDGHNYCYTKTGYVNTTGINMMFDVYTGTQYTKFGIGLGDGLGGALSNLAYGLVFQTSPGNLHVLENNNDRGQVNSGSQASLSSSLYRVWIQVGAPSGGVATATYKISGPIEASYDNHAFGQLGIQGTTGTFATLLSPSTGSSTATLYPLITATGQNTDVNVYPSGLSPSAWISNVRVW